MNRRIDCNLFSSAQEYFAVTGCHGVQLPNVERTRISTVVPDGTRTLHQSLQPGTQPGGCLAGIVQVIM